MTKRTQVFRSKSSTGFDEDYVYYVSPEDEREVLLDFNYNQKVDFYEDHNYDWQDWKLN